MFEIIQRNDLWELCIKLEDRLIPLGITSKQKRHVIDEVLNNLRTMFDNEYKTSDYVSGISNADGDIYLSRENGFEPNSVYAFFPVKSDQAIVRAK